MCIHHYLPIDSRYKNSCIISRLKTSVPVTFDCNAMNDKRRLTCKSLLCHPIANLNFHYGFIDVNEPFYWHILLVKMQFSFFVLLNEWSK